MRDLRAALADQGQDGWIDSRELRGGDPLWQEIQTAIEEASGYAIVVSPDAFQSDWVGDELAHALKVQEQRGRAVTLQPCDRAAVVRLGKQASDEV